VKKTVIFDLDGTLANIDHRLHFIEGDKKNWDAFFEACDKDSLVTDARDLMNGLKDNFEIIILTGRSISVLDKTKSWLRRHDCEYDRLIMRSMNNFIPDNDLKEAWGKKFGFENILCVFEDRFKVVEMWRKNGVFCAQIADGQF
jgi:phosphoglycolate phosphatase-like HAD superfamily hydrolase